ncbi:MAG: hypothetical protein QOI66_1190 [Myxococcales bacterium]|jgi:hypothetical protein|nr:hypothetical protein [Myxococcales bacterium]
MRDKRSWFLSSVLLLGVGCTGSIDETGPGSSPSGGGGSGNPGNPGNPGTGNNPLPPGAKEPGRVTLRRLNQTEYDNTVRDLLGTLSHPAKAFLSDTVANGFDNNGDSLTLSPVRLQQYQQAAETLATEALAPPLRTQNLSCDPAAGDACVRTFLTTLGQRAYRRPLTDDEIARYLTLAGKVRTAGGSPDEVINAVLQALLVSPNFLFRPEFDPDPKSLTPHLLAPYELASRLSYLVYASMPDDALFTAAKTGKLAAVKDVQAQLQRMLADPKSRLSQNYAEQWLGVRTVETAQPDPKLYPAFNAALGASMKREVDLFFDEFVRQNLPIDQLLTANFTYLDDSLAKHYGVPAVGGTDLSRVTLSTPQRGGLFGMGALLVATSRGNRTSPVSRGRFTLDALMCADPPPPPGNFMPPTEDTITATDARTFLENHRMNPACASCHNQMDPIGLALENYDAIGAWRDTDHGKPIDVSGVLLDGTKFSGRAELETALAKDPRVGSCLAKNLMAYSLGRSVGDKDQGYVDDAAKATGGGKLGMRDLLMNVVASDAFRMRRGEP